MVMVQGKQYQSTDCYRKC